MSSSNEKLVVALQGALGENLVSVRMALGEVTAEIASGHLLQAALTLRDAPELAFGQLTDLCGIDYSAWGQDATGVADGEAVPSARPRFAVIYHLLSIPHNRRLRLRVYAPDAELPSVDSVADVWPAANWYEREAFDLFGIVFPGHPDLRRILTDYGFVGHPFRKDFPLSGHVEMRYDPTQQRVIYQPVTIEPRVITPRIIREENYAGVKRET